MDCEVEVSSCVTATKLIPSRCPRVAQTPRFFRQVLTVEMKSSVMAFLRECLVSYFIDI